jgi:hypothetical protein
MKKLVRPLILLLIPILVVGFLSREAGQFMSYDQLATLLSANNPSRSMEYITLPHPAFEFISYQLGMRVMSVKLTDRGAERYVLVPENRMSNLLEKMEKLNIQVIAIN